MLLRDILAFAGMALVLIGLSWLMASAGEPGSVWLWRDVLGVR